MEYCLVDASSISGSDDEVKDFVSKKTHLTLKMNSFEFIYGFARGHTEITMTRQASSSCTNSTPKPARKLVEVSPHRTTGGAFIAGLMHYDAEHESYVERDAIATLALCRDVKTISTQPATILLVSEEGKTSCFTPDIEVATELTSQLIEVKAIKTLASAAARKKYSAIAHHLANKNQRFAFLTDAQINVAPRYKTVKLLFRYITNPIKEGTLARTIVALKSGPRHIDEVLSVANLQLVDVYTLISRRRLDIDWSKPLDRHALVSLPDQHFKGLRLEHILSSSRFSSFLAKLALGRDTADQRILADAKAWRSHDEHRGSFNFVGGFVGATVDGDLGSPKQSAGGDECRRDIEPDWSVEDDLSA